MKESQINMVDDKINNKNKMDLIKELLFGEEVKEIHHKNELLQDAFDQKLSEMQKKWDSELSLLVKNSEEKIKRLEENFESKIKNSLDLLSQLEHNINKGLKAADQNYVSKEALLSLADNIKKSLS